MASSLCHYLSVACLLGNLALLYINTLAPTSSTSETLSAVKENATVTEKLDRALNSSNDSAQSDLGSKDRLPGPAGSGPIRHFVFHALHKTGSAHTRGELEKFCFDERLDCLTYQACSAQFSQCAGGLSMATGRELEINRGSLTPYRMRQGCCPRLLAKERRRGGPFKFHGIVEHLPLSVAGNRELLKKRSFPDSFRFTVLRDPAHQLLSYFRFLKRQPDYFAPRLRDVDVAAFVADPNRDPLLGRMLVNSQATELGWDGTEEGLVAVEQLLRSLDFVGLFEDLQGTWRRLRQRLRYQAHEPQRDPLLGRMLVNSQATELGWDGTEEGLVAVEQLLRSLDFVGLFEDLQGTWRRLRQRLRYQAHEPQRDPLLGRMLVNSQATELGWDGTEEGLVAVEQLLRSLDFVGLFEDLQGTWRRLRQRLRYQAHEPQRDPLLGRMLVNSQATELGWDGTEEGLVAVEQLLRSLDFVGLFEDLQGTWRRLRQRLRYQAHEPQRDPLLGRMLVNSQATELGWDGTEEGLVAVEQLLRSLDFVGLFEDLQGTWRRLRQRLRYQAHEPQRDPLLGRMLVNSQATELGWDGTEEGLVAVEQLLRSLDFVGLFEDLQGTWRRLRQRLRWDEKYFNYTRREPKSDALFEGLGEATVERIRQLQWADQRLYQEAQRLFNASS